MVIVALDATYSTGNELSGIGVYSRELLERLAATYPDARFRHLYRSQALLKASAVAGNVSRGLLMETWRWPRGEDLFHGLNQRMPRIKFTRSACTLHDLFVLTGEYSSREFRDRFAKQAREAAARADLIITVSQFTADQVHDLLAVERSRLRVVRHGVRALPRTDIAREPIILTVGAVQHRKNTMRLVEAFEAVPPPWRLVIAGAATGYGSGRILARIHDSPARSRIEVTGYVSPMRLAQLYGSASVFAFPSLDEGFGMPVIEAMASGVPVVASNRSALPEVCGDAALLVDPLRSEEIAETLRSLCADAGLRQRLQDLGRAQASRFTWDGAVRATWSVYEELFSRQTAGIRPD